MLMKKPVGRGGSTRKYDLLTILGVHALTQDRALQRRVLRLICLITARYNWQNDQLSVGQAEIARLWSVDPRTVKREMAALRAMGWLVERRAAARGRVTVYGLGFERILDDTRTDWGRVGEDLVLRLDTSDSATPEQPQGARVIPFPQSPLPNEASIWGRVARQLQAADPAVFAAWLQPLICEETVEGLTLRAPSGFHATWVETHLAARIAAVLAQIAPGLRLRIC